MAETIVVGAEPLIAFYWDEPGADDVEEVIDDVEAGETRGWINTVPCIEVRYVCGRDDAAKSRQYVSRIRDWFDVVTAEDVWERAADYKQEDQVPLGDAFTLATAEEKTRSRTVVPTTILTISTWESDASVERASNVPIRPRPLSSPLPIQPHPFLLLTPYRPHMDVVVYGPLRSAVGGKRTAIDVDGDTVADVLEAFVETYPGTADQLYTDDGSLRPSVRIMYDGERIEPGDPCPDGGELALFPAMRGG